MESRAERRLCIFWHGVLIGMGVWEAWTHKNKVNKFFAFGFAVWHADATASHIFQRETYSKQVLRKITGIRG